MSGGAKRGPKGAPMTPGGTRQPYALTWPGYSEALSGPQLIRFEDADQLARMLLRFGRHQCGLEGMAAAKWTRAGWVRLS